MHLLTNSIWLRCMDLLIYHEIVHFISEKEFMIVIKSNAHINLLLFIVNAYTTRALLYSSLN